MPTIGKSLLYFLSLGVAGYTAFAYGFMPLGAVVHPEMKASFLAHPTGIYTHAFASLLALALGPFQFSAQLRHKYPRVHRWSGRAYLGVGVLAGGLAGLYMAQYAYGGLAARLGFALLALAWLYTGLRAFLAIRSGAVAAHRQWMVRNFALTLAAVTLRIYVPASFAAGIDFAHAYPVIAWLCWVPNIVFAEWRYNLSRNRSLPAT
jgi:uncharacterized membrane protein